MSTDVIKFHCPNCDKRLGVRTEEMHLSFVCPKCNRKIKFSSDALPEHVPAPAPMNATTIVQGQETSTQHVPTQKSPKITPVAFSHNAAPVQLKKIALEKQKEKAMQVHTAEPAAPAEEVAPKRRFTMPKKG